MGYVVLRTEPVALAVDLPGRVAPFETAEVRPQVSGIIRRRLFEEGSVVHAGQVLYEIEDAPYRAAVLTAQGQLAVAQAGLRPTELQSERYRALAEMRGVSKQDADDAQAAAEKAKATVLAQRGVLAVAEVNQGFTLVRAPISGRIGRSLATRGALVQAGQPAPLATIQRLDMVYVDVAQSAADLLKLRAALATGDVARRAVDEARVRLILPDGAVYPRDGVLRFADVTVDPATGAVVLRAAVPNPDSVLLPGLYVRAHLVEGVRQQGLLAPQAGISRNERGEATALILGPGDVVAQRVVRTDSAIGDKWIITSGLKAGDRLVIDGLVNLRPGAKVQARPVLAAG